MNNDPAIHPVPPSKPCTPQQAPTPPMPQPSFPPPIPNPMHRQFPQGAGSKLALEREAPQPPPAPDSGVKRCLAIAASGKRCRREGRNFKNGLCRFHDPARAEELHDMRVRGAEAMVRNKAMRRRGMAPRNVVSYLECLRRVDGRKESICAAFDWISEKLLQGEIDPKTAQQLRVLAGRRNRVMASYSKPCSRRSPQRATPPTGVPPPELPPLGMDESPDAP